MVLSFRHQLEKTGKKMEKSGKNRYILTLTRAFIFINILAILVESEHEQARDKISIRIGVKFIYNIEISIPWFVHNCYFSNCV